MGLMRHGKSRNQHVDSRDKPVFDRWIQPHIGGVLQYDPDGSVSECGLVLAQDEFGATYGYKPCGKCDICDAARHSYVKERLREIWDEEVTGCITTLPCDVHFIVEDTSSIPMNDRNNPINKLKRFLSVPSNLITSFTSCKVFYITYGEHRCERRHVHIQFVTDKLITQTIRRTIRRIAGGDVDIRSEQETNPTTIQSVTLPNGRKTATLVPHKDVIVDRTKRRILNPKITANDILYRGAYILRGAHQIENRNDAAVTTRSKHIAFYLHNDLTPQVLARVKITRLAYRTTAGVVQIANPTNTQGRILIENIDKLRFQSAKSLSEISQLLVESTT